MLNFAKKAREAFQVQESLGKKGKQTPDQSHLSPTTHQQGSISQESTFKKKKHPGTFQKQPRKRSKHQKNPRNLPHPKHLALRSVRRVGRSSQRRLPPRRCGDSRPCWRCHLSAPKKKKKKKKKNSARGWGVVFSSLEKTVRKRISLEVLWETN